MKLGVTMEGGANRTIYSCGVTDVLLEENIMPDGIEIHDLRYVLKRIFFIFQVQ